MKKIIGITSLILLVFFWIPTPLAADPAWEYIYEGDILPDDTSLGDNAWELVGDNRFAEITDQSELHIDDVGANHCFFLYNVADPDLMQQATIEARVKVLSQSGSANFEVLVGMQDGSNSKWLDLFPDHILLNNTTSTYDVDMTEYHILRMVRDTDDIHIYVDDEEVISEPHVGAGESWIGFIFGAGCTACTSEQYWDYLVFTTEGAFSPGELPSYASIRGTPDLAYAPKPADGSLHPDTWANLSWRAGLSAVTHDVYFGENFDDVNSGVESTFIGNQAATFLVVGFPGFPSPDGLVPGTTYYWRVDEVNDADPNSPWKGNVWSFSIPPKTAYFPNPANETEGVSVDPQLSWTLGFGAKLHTVYFGETFEEVDTATGGQAQGTAEFTPGTLKMAKTYYWRVDEFDIFETHKGDVWSFTTEGAVSNPVPAKSAVDVTQTPVLTWTPGLSSTHEIYFGTDASTLEKKGSGNLGSESYDPGQLEWNTTYYWRIDEANSTNADSPWTGPLWSFTTANFLIIDDFEAYNDLDESDPVSNRIYLAWLDGFDNPATNGSVVGYANPPFAEQRIVHSGNQSMPMAYDNTVGKSEATLTLNSNRDWTVNDVNTLTIWFRGSASNAAEQMYVALNGSVVVNHDNPEAAQKGYWIQWNIDLQAFADQGVNLANVNSITLGLNSVTGGAGMMYFDDIRLYAP
ncbi:MAG: hypothetical protein GY774_38940 [Planctomycetes bacterium]|nr:hypothetical protein [Planctomycetota bacterium]